MLEVIRRGDCRGRHHRPEAVRWDDEHDLLRARVMFGSGYGTARAYG
jgi:hypothetical protein